MVATAVESFDAIEDHHVQQLPVGVVPAVVQAVRFFILFPRHAVYLIRQANILSIVEVNELALRIAGSWVHANTAFGRQAQLYAS